MKKTLGGRNCATKTRSIEVTCRLKAKTTRSKEGLKLHAQAEARDARVHDLGDLVELRRIDVIDATEHRAAVEDVEDVDVERHLRPLERERLLDARIQRLHGGQAVLADVGG